MIVAIIFYHLFYEWFLFVLDHEHPPFKHHFLWYTQLRFIKHVVRPIFAGLIFQEDLLCHFIQDIQQSNAKATEQEHECHLFLGQDLLLHLLLFYIQCLIVNAFVIRYIDTVWWIAICALSYQRSKACFAVLVAGYTRFKFKLTLR